MYVKLWDDILDSSLWDEPSDTRIVWITLLAMSNADGYVRGTTRAIARRACVDIEATEAALSKFQSPDNESRIEAHEGRRIEAAPGGFMLLNYKHYRELQQERDRREYMRKLMAEKREAERKAAAPLAPVSNPLAPVSNVSQQAYTEAEAYKDSRAGQDKPARPPIKEFFYEWNTNATKLGLPLIRGSLGPKRAKSLKARWKDKQWRKDWVEALHRIKGCPFLLGESDGGWQANAAFFLRPDSVGKIMEGNYSGSGGGQKRPGDYKPESHREECRDCGRKGCTIVEGRCPKCYRAWQDKEAAR